MNFHLLIIGLIAFYTIKQSSACLDAGEECGSDSDCCPGLECHHMGSIWSHTYICIPEEITTLPDNAEICKPLMEECSYQDERSCCPGLSCQANGYGPGTKNVCFYAYEWKMKNWCISFWKFLLIPFYIVEHLILLSGAWIWTRAWQ